MTPALAVALLLGVPAIAAVFQVASGLHHIGNAIALLALRDRP